MGAKESRRKKRKLRNSIPDYIPSKSEAKEILETRISTSMSLILLRPGLLAAERHGIPATNSLGKRASAIFASIAKRKNSY